MQENERCETKQTFSKEKTIRTGETNKNVGNANRTKNMASG